MDKHEGDSTLPGFLAFLCLGARAVLSSPPEGNSRRESGSAEAFNIEPLRLVYRHVEGIYLKAPRGVFVDQTRQEVYVADTANDLVAVYDLEGLPLFAFGYNGEFKEPVKAVADPQGRIYVLTAIDRAIKIFNYRGEYQQDFPFEGLDEAPAPTALTADGKGNLYIADATSNQVLVYDSKYRLKLRLGVQGNGRFEVVQGIAVDPEGNIYVADARAVPIQVFSPQGKLLRVWGEHASGPQNFSFPSGITIDQKGRVIVVDTIRQTLQVFTKEGEFLGRYGGLGSRPGMVAFPTDVAADADGRIYVVERVGNRLQIMQQRLQTASTAREQRNSPPAHVRQKIRSLIAAFAQDMQQR